MCGYGYGCQMHAEQTTTLKNTNEINREVAVAQATSISVQDLCRFFFILFFLPGLEMSLRITNQWTEREEEAHSSHFRPFWSFKRDLYGKGAYNNIE